MTRQGALITGHRSWPNKAAIMLLAPILLLAGCGSVQPEYYILTAQPGTPESGGPRTIEVRTPNIAGYLNRDYIVRSNSGDKLHFIRNAAWAEPLAESIARNLALDLSQRLPGSNVYPANGGMTLKAEAVLDVSVSHFAENNAGQAEIMATISVHRSNAAAADMTSLHVVAPVKDDSAEALTVSLSQLLGQVADEAAKRLRALGPGH